MSTLLKKLHEMRELTGPAQTVGLSDEVISKFAADHPKLGQAVDEAYEQFNDLRKTNGSVIERAEKDLINELQVGFVNFYPEAQTNPYVALSARGPWVVSLHGAVLHDSGGYGMLGFGHGPQPVIDTMAENHVMANVMTASLSQHKVTQALLKEIGHSRKDQPFKKFIAMNSGSESVTVAARISDVHAKIMTDPGGRYEGRKIMYLAMKGGFHGRTDRPAHASSSCLGKYRDALASFRDYNHVHEIEPNSTAALEAAFKWADDNNVYFEMMFAEPVMGEGNPGQAMAPEYYKVARELTKQHGTLLLMDSIQAGLRAQGTLSMVDYPGFQDLEGPDLETYSKALNAGQYPLSILAMNDATADMYVRGIYGNTMTTNPRALEIACTVLGQLTPALRQNIRDRGAEFVEKMKRLQKEFPDIITQVQGTGLLCAAFINPERAKVVGFGCLEEYMRMHGIGVIHGGENALRFTPHFEITSEELDLVCEQMRQAFTQGPVQRQPGTQVG